MVGGIYAHLGDMLTSQYQPIDWTQYATYKLQAALGWGNRLVPCTMHDETSHKISQDLDVCFNLH